MFNSLSLIGVILIYHPQVTKLAAILLSSSQTIPAYKLDAQEMM